MGRKSEIDILSSFDNDRPQTAAEIVKNGACRSTVFRALGLLVEVGFLHQQPGTSSYVPGLRSSNSA